MGRESPARDRIVDMDSETPDLTVAYDADVSAVVALMNLAFRSPGSDAGWTTEVEHFQGDRTSDVLLREDIGANVDVAMLIWRSTDGVLLGCVWLEPEGDGVWYLGSLTIDPRQQTQPRPKTLGSGGELGSRARRSPDQNDGHQRSRHAHRLVCPLRLRTTDEVEPFRYGYDRFGIPRCDDLHFVVLRKRLVS